MIKFIDVKFCDHSYSFILRYLNSKQNKYMCHKCKKTILVADNAL
jgi:transposase-like protein